MRYKYIVVYQLTGILCTEENSTGLVIDLAVPQACAKNY